MQETVESTEERVYSATPGQLGISPDQTPSETELEKFCVESL